LRRESHAGLLVFMVYMLPPAYTHRVGWKRSASMASEGGRSLQTTTREIFNFLSTFHFHFHFTSFHSHDDPAHTRASSERFVNWVAVVQLGLLHAPHTPHASEQESVCSCGSPKKVGRTFFVARYLVFLNTAAGHGTRAAQALPGRRRQHRSRVARHERNSHASAARYRLGAAMGRRDKSGEVEGRCDKASL
jgi:hypothetical protein